MLFLGQSVEKTQATGCFHRFLLFAYKRNAVFPIFCISLASESQFSVFFVRRLQAKRCFSRFLHFACERKHFFFISNPSSVDEKIGRDYSSPKSVNGRATQPSSPT